MTRIADHLGENRDNHSSKKVREAGGHIGRVGVPHYAGIPALQPFFYQNITVAGGPAPVRAYMNELLRDVVEGRIQPGRVFDSTIDLNDVPAGYRAMDGRECLKVMVKP